MDCKKNGALGSSFGKLGGKPKNGPGVTNSELFHGEPYGMKVDEYQEMVTFLESPQSAPIYPKSIAGGSSKSKDGKKNKSSRKEFRKKCNRYTVVDSDLYRAVLFCGARTNPISCKDEELCYRSRVAKRGEVNYDLFKQFHHDKGHIRYRQGRETLRQH